MFNQRGILIFVFALFSYMLFVSWQQDYGQKPSKPPVTEKNTPQIPDVNTVSKPSSNQVESAIPTVKIDKSSNVQIKDNTPVSVSSLIKVSTDVMTVLINPEGGDIVSTQLLKYPVSKDQPENKVHIFTNQNNRVYFAQSGLLGANTPDGSSKKAHFVAEKQSYTFTNDQNKIDVKLQWVNEEGIKFQKIFQFQRNSYDIHLNYSVINNSNQEFNTRLYTQLMRDTLAAGGGDSGVGMRSFLGAAYSTEETRYEKVKFDDLKEDKINLTTNDGWVAILQHYFVSAWIPENKKGNQLYSLTPGNNVVIGLVQPTVTVAPGEEKEFQAQLYVGPKNQKVLRGIAKGLDLTIDYGFLWWIGQPIFAIMKFLHSIVGNWGVAIILVTLVVKLFLFPLSNAQYRSFGKMRKLQPKMQALKERYGDDRQKMGQETMKLYKKEGVNPLGGCLPVLIQMPVFFALYWVLFESVEIRQAPFIFWIQDLSLKDPYFVLPLLMGLSMWITQKMQPAAANMDPMQQKIMQFMPVVMTFFFLFFPAGLVLYWVVNNVLTIIQQTYVNKKMEREDLKKAK